jgi:acyl-CoA thioesterase FadM
MSLDETGAVVARTTLKGVYIDTAARKSCLLPSNVLANASAMLNGAR